MSDTTGVGDGLWGDSSSGVPSRHRPQSLAATISRIASRRVPFGVDDRLGTGWEQLLGSPIAQCGVGGVVEEGLEPRRVLGEDAKGVERTVVAERGGLWHAPGDALERGRVAEQHRAEGRERLRVGEQRRIVDPLEPRLGDVVAVTEVDGVPVVQRPVEHADQLERVTGQTRQRLVLDASSEACPSA